MADRSSKKSKKSHGAPAVASAATDARFAQFQSDPLYRLPRRKDTHVKVDKRFARMFDDDEFTKKAKVDRYGRRVSSEAGKKALKKLYDVEKDEEDDDEDIQAELDRLDATAEGTAYDPARQGGFADASSSEEESSSDEDSEDEPEAELEETLDPESGDIPTGDVTTRLAVVNLDWDNIRAVDLMAVAQSFCPPAGRIRNVTVYPSEFGRERMEREETEGPAPELFKSKSKATQDVPEDSASEEELDESEDSEDDAEIASRLQKASTNTEANAEIDHRALRAYQLSRLRYYYAVVTADSAATAKHIYDAMDGSEYLSSANFFDLRFVPDETDFDSDKPRDACSKVPAGYRPAEFVTEALMHSKVQLTWDADDTARKEAQKRAFAGGTEMAEGDLAAYLGSDSDDDGDDDNEFEAGTAANGDKKKDDARAKMRALLGLPAESERAPRKARDDEAQGNMQITFTAGLSGDATDHSSAFVNRPEDVVEETTVEKYVRKEKERKARRRAKAKAARNGEDVGDEDGQAEVDEQQPTKPSVSNADADAEDPFNDPFFADPDSANQAARKESKRRARAERDAAVAASASKEEAERAALTKLMGDDATGAHFDMAKLRKGEKEAARKGKKKSVARREAAAEAAADDFKMDVETDPRFARMLDSHEYAIDPTSARYSGSKAMKGVLEAGRRRREGLVESGKKRKGQSDGDSGEASALVKKLKKKKKKNT